MGADQNLINAVKRMGPSRFRDDSGWIKALGAVGKYVAVKQKQFNEATENFSGVIEDVDIDGLVQYKEEVNGLLKTMKNVPAFMPKYKKAANRYNEIMSNIEGTKTLLSSLAKKKDKIGTNKSNLSIYQDVAEMAVDSDVMQGNYTVKMSDKGPVMTINGMQEILVSDYVQKNPILRSDSTTNEELIFEVIKTHGSDAKINNKKYAEVTTGDEVSQVVEKMWITGNDKTTILFNTPYKTINGEMTFMDYYANKDVNYQKSIEKTQENKITSDQPVSMTQLDISSEADIDEAANLLKRELWKNTSDEKLKREYKKFIQEEVIKYQYETNEGKVYKDGKLVSDKKLFVGKSIFDNSSLWLNESVVRIVANRLANPKLGDIENWWEGDSVRYKAVYMTRPGTDGGVMKDANNKPIIGWQEIDKDGNPVGDVMDIDYTIYNKYNIKDPNLRLTRIVKPPL